MGVAHSGVIVTLEDWPPAGQVKVESSKLK